MNIFRKIVCFLAAVSLLLAACAGGDKVKKPRYDCSQRVAQAIAKYDKGKFSPAKTMLDDVKLQCTGHEVFDTAQYYLGMALARMKMFIEANLEFTRLVQDFPRSAFFEEAQFMIGYTVFRQSRSVDRDQTETRQAIRFFNDFLENYPSSVFADSAVKYLKIAVDKMAMKEFNNARFYQKIREREAAVVYYKSFVSDYPASTYASLARLNMGQALIELGRKAEAKEVLNELVAQEKNGEIAAKARTLLAQCKE